MSERSTERESSFTWPPPADDMDQLSILDLSRKPLLSDLAPAPRQAASRESRRRAPRVWARAWHEPGWHALAAATGRFGLFAAGMMVGAVLVGAAIEPWASEKGVGPAAPNARETSSEGEALRAMRAVLRGERRPDVAHPAPPILAVGPTTTPAEGDSSRPADDGAAMPAQGSPGIGTNAPALVSASGPGAVPGSGLSGGVTPSPAAPRMDSRVVRVRYALGAYERAVTRSDTAATREVWPSANAKALTDAFSAVREQRLQLGACDVDVQGERATAICRGTLRYRPRVGDHSTRIRRGRWEFQLERTEGRWIIQSVDAP